MKRVSAFVFTLAVFAVTLLQGWARPAAAAPAAMFTVNSFVDQIDDLLTPGTCHALNMPPGTCTLRAAVMQANRTSGLGATISLPAGIYSLTIPITGTNDETSGDLNLTTPSAGNPFINIMGAGAATTIIDAGQLDRAFSIAANRTTGISDVTIRNGFAGDGGGINNAGTATLSNVTLSANSSNSNGGGIYNGGTGTLNLNNTTVSGNSAAGLGGGISNYDSTATLNLNNTTVSVNLANVGGGIYSQGTGTLINSTLSGNTAGSEGGGIYSLSSLILVNSTLSSNIASNNGGGMSIPLGTVNVYNSSILFNGTHPDIGSGGGGGVYIQPSPTFNMRNTLLAGNYTSVDRLNDDCSGTVHLFGVNLFGAIAGCTIDTSSGSYFILNSEAFIGPLQNNGGPTWTHALLKGSNAIYQGYTCVDNNGNTLTTDQRGAPRLLVAFLICDIGAFEYRPPLYLPLIQR